jgi:hypothetical protein
MRRYRLLITAGDETGETDFILFGRMAQRIVKKPLDILIAELYTHILIFVCSLNKPAV